MRRLIPILLLVVLPSTLSAQFWQKPFGRTLKKIDAWLEKGQRSGIDTTYQDIPKLNRQMYLGGYAYWQNYNMRLPLYMSSVIRNQIPEQPEWSNYRINAYTTQAELELGIDWKGLAIEIPIPLHNNFTASYGLAKNGSVWGFRLRYKHMETLKGRRSFDMPESFGSIQYDDDDTKLQEYINWLKSNKIDKNQHDIRTFYAEGYYVLNHKKFSLSAGLYADMVQKKSAGSVLFYGNYFQSNYYASDVIVDYNQFRTRQFSLGAGYGYNLSLLNGRLLFHASIVPLFSLYTELKHSYKFTNEAHREEYNRLFPSNEPSLFDAVKSGDARIRVNAFGRFSANYSFDRYIITLLVNYRHYGYSNNKHLLIRNQDADVQANFCVRF